MMARASSINSHFNQLDIVEICWCTKQQKCRCHQQTSKIKKSGLFRWGKNPSNSQICNGSIWTKAREPWTMIFAITGASYCTSADWFPNRSSPHVSTRISRKHILGSHFLLYTAHSTQCHLISSSPLSWKQRNGRWWFLLSFCFAGTRRTSF